MDNCKTLERLEAELSKLKSDYTAASDDGRFRNITFGAAGHLSKGSRNYMYRHRDKLCRITDEITMCKRAVKIVRGEAFNNEDMDECRRDIMHLYKDYERPYYGGGFTVAYMAEGIVLSFFGKYRSVLNRFPVILDFENNNGLYYYNPDKTITHKWPEPDP